MRFQPAWILEAVPHGEVDSIFLPLSPRASSLFWFKRLGIRLYANDPVESQAVLLRALLQNKDSVFPETIARKINRYIPKPIDLQLNPFRSWLDDPFSREQVDYLFYWREAGTEIAEPIHRDLFQTAIRSVLSYWLAFSRVRRQPPLPADDVLGQILEKQKNLVFQGKEEVFALGLPFEELGDEVEASLYLSHLPVKEVHRSTTRLEEFFHAWVKGNPDLDAAREEIDNLRKPWMFSWKRKPDFSLLPKKAGKARFAAIFWSSGDAPPRLHEEHVMKPLREAFAPVFPRSTTLVKTADRIGDEYDFLTIFQKAS